MAVAAVITMALTLVFRPAQAAAALIGGMGMGSTVAEPAFLLAGALRPLPRPLGCRGWASRNMPVMASADSDEGRERAALLEEGRRRLAKAEAQRAVMVEARKEKMRRHKRKREGQLKQVSEAERARRRAQEAAAGAVMEWLYEHSEEEVGGRVGSWGCGLEGFEDLYLNPRVLN